MEKTPKTDGQKISAMREAFRALAKKQIVPNNISTWATEGAEEIAAFAMLDLFNLIAGEG